MTFKRYTDIVAWQAAKELTVLVYRLTESPRLAKEFWFKDQVRRAALSTMANIAEGFGRGSDADFVRFLHYSRASAFEVGSAFHLATDLALVDAASSAAIQSACDRTVNLITKLLIYLAPDRVREDQETEYRP